MKKLSRLAAIAGMTALLVSCNNVSSMLGGAKYPADQADSYAKAVEILKEKVDTTKFKIFAMRFNEREELSNDLSSISLDMVNADNYAFRQAYYMDGRVGQMNDFSTSVNEIDYAKIKGISLSAEGEIFLGYARQVLEQAAVLEDKYKGEHGEKKKFCVSTQHYSFAVNAFVDLIKRNGQDEYDFSIRETQTYEIIEDVARMRSEIGLLFLNDFNETVLRKILKSNGLEFHLLFVARPHVFISRRHPLADREVITNEELEDYPYLSFEQGEHNSFYFSEEVFSVSERKKNIRVRDRATLFNLLIGLNGYTVCSGVIDENLNGKDIIAVPLADENEMKIGYIVHQKNRISRLGTTYLKALEKYLDPKEEPGRECLHMRQE